MTQNLLQGWCTDPYGIHEARWMSAGNPTKLVLDHGRESYDPAPAGEPPFEPEWFDSSHATAVPESRLHSASVSETSPALRKVAAKVLHPIHH